MYSLILLALVAFVASLSLTPLVRCYANRAGLVDIPDNQRKIHTVPVPRIGGIAVVLSYLAAFAVLLLSSLQGGSIVKNALPVVARMLPAALLMFAVGIADDVLNLRPWQKLAGQIAACLAAPAAGVVVHSIAGFTFHPVLAVVITVLWLLACTNALNLIDGVDGLAAGIGFFASLTLAISGYLQGNVPLQFATVPLAAALFAFLRYNFNPASIFLGDSGSLPIGFLLGCFAVLWSQKSATILGITAPLLALAIPLLDTSLAIVRRFLRQQPIFGADRSHIHHRLLARGLNPRRVALLLYTAAGACACLSLLLTVVHAQFSGFILVVFCLGTWLGVQQLGYIEFGTARKMVLRGAFRRLLNAQISLDDFARRLGEASTLDECWNVLQSDYAAFGFSAIRLEFAGLTRSATLDCHQDALSWSIRIALPGQGQLHLLRSCNMQNHLTLAASFAEVVGQTLPGKLREHTKPAVLAAAASAGLA